MSRVRENTNMNSTISSRTRVATLISMSSTWMIEHSSHSNVAEAESEEISRKLESLMDVGKSSDDDPETLVENSVTNT